ncbi:hypothetical protein Ga0074812_14533 [Parafrankia irregularis]|uniref:Uncharacterized protein n=1 Tax=Parafrankia irregularis TaxID=795642 RepID=A0A0S4QYT5_9ACTN|nr:MULTISPECIES: hypothetical protein [Parafrankia]MBE3200427.1 hypothetical protein [Parafrankia sp. CH37]CUU60711.1 hypothetical protein Ga0074812_14533 [Parafrankia irregularis]
MPVSDPDPDRDGRPVIPAGRLATVWTCPPDSPTRPPVGWLQAAVEQLVTTHTRPGDPVLLLIPPGPDAPAGGRRETPADRHADAGWAVARLGRRVQVRTVPAVRAVPPSGSGRGPDSTDEGPDTDRRPLVITVVDPARTGWVRGVPWARLLTPDGILAVITRSESVDGWLIDPTAELTAAAGGHGLALLDRFIVLEVSLDDLDQPPGPLPRASVARRVHTDLLLFAAYTAVSPTSGVPR